MRQSMNNWNVTNGKEPTNKEIAKKIDDDKLAVGNVLVAIGIQNVTPLHIIRLK